MPHRQARRVAGGRHAVRPGFHSGGALLVGAAGASVLAARRWLGHPDHDRCPDDPAHDLCTNHSTHGLAMSMSSSGGLSTTAPAGCGAMPAVKTKDFTFMIPGPVTAPRRP